MRRTVEMFLVAGLAMLVCGVASGEAPGAAPDQLSPIWRGIREVGFPAAAFVLLYAMQWRVLGDLVSAIREMREELASCRAWREGQHGRR